MSKERKCRKCKLTYTGHKTHCPYCHKRTKFGTLNNIMAVIGYLTTANFLFSLTYYLLIIELGLTYLFIPVILFIALIVGIIFLILK